MGKAYFKLNFFLYIFALLVCGSCQTYLQLFEIDPATGFYSRNSLPVVIFYTVLGVVVVFMLLVNRLRVTDNDYPVSQDNRGIPFPALLVGATLALFVIEGTGWLPLILPVTGTPLTGVSVWICGILGCLAVLFFLCLGLPGPNKAPALLSLIPPVWQLVLLVSKFNSYPTLTTVPDNLLTVLFMVAASMFLMGNSRTLYGFSRKDGQNYTIPAGLITSLLGLLLVVPNYVYAVVMHAPLPAPSLGNMESLYITAMSLYSLASVIQLRREIAIV